MQTSAPSFKAEYTNSASENRYWSTLTLNADHLSIQYFDSQTQTEKNVVWMLDHISSNNWGRKQGIVLKYNDFLDSKLLITDSSFGKIIANTYPKYFFATECYKPLFSKATKRIFGVLGGLILLLALAYFVILPKAAEYIAGIVPVKVEESISESTYQDLTRNTNKNMPKSEAVNLFFKEMGLKASYDYKIIVINSDEVNAFALPAGRIVVYTELIHKMKNYDELAAVLAHEYAHVELRHSLKSVFRSLAGSILLSVALGGVDGAGVLQNAHIFSDLQYSRKAEREADLYGLNAMIEKGIDPQGMINFFETLKDENEDGLSGMYVSEFVSTHPLFNSRIEYIEKFLSTHSAQYTPNAKLDSLWQVIKTPGAVKVWK